MKILYFAWLRTKAGVGAEEVTPPASVTDVASLLDWLKTRSAGHEAALADLSAVRVAVNQEFARPTDPVKPGDEVALFPPMTGG
ncbi:MAG: molybdopterin converting factor subunit 1 [Candidatus Eiseniibacteriota bacterium]